MRTASSLLVAAALALVAPAARAQTAGRDAAIGTSGPASNRASNIDRADTPGGIAPHLPGPATPEDSGPDGLLRAADRALAEHHTGAAQEALERAETRLLDRSTEVDASSRPDQDPRVLHVSAALQALGRGDIAAARAGIAVAMQGDMPPATMPGMTPPMQQPPMQRPLSSPR